MAENTRQVFRDPLQNLHEHEWREHRETIQRYESAGRFGRWLIRRQNPRAVDYYQYLKAQESVTAARMAAAADPNNERIIGSAA